MNHHIYHVLSDWFPQRDAGNWLLATIINTEGSSYRKAGAMMLFSEFGSQLGVVSGGCLESDLLHQSRRCWETGNSRIVTYDMQEEGDVAWRLGIGCGGEVTLLLQPVSAQNNWMRSAGSKPFIFHSRSHRAFLQGLRRHLIPATKHCLQPHSYHLPRWAV